LALVRVAQEALTNALKHAPGGRVQVDLHFAEHQVELTVEDGGGGARSPLAGAGGGYGLQGMRERAELVGGSLSAGPVGSGWRVQAVVPT
jgi:signal transduction histidine kinase